ncbi:methionine aminotransferase [Sporocytophaga myxococcoides]|uniref:methionine aminotransferase n=1 Tax=Sporocytophaga myxococcoides TaxID=153721 RepID=UPI00048B3C2F|nr:methionine aminotransferase [Sporocytophaga myxococcoides]
MITKSTGSKLPDIGTTIFTIMSQMARDYNAINLAQGFPDFKCSNDLVDLVTFYMKKGFNQYAPMTGVQVLREKIAVKSKELYGASVDPDKEVTLTCGATEACYTAITSIVKPGDEVIIFEPAFDCYIPAIQLSGGKPVFIELQYPDYKIDWDLVRKKITEKTSLIIINSPHNPTGAIISKQDIDALTELVRDTDITILSDEVYEHIIFDRAEHHSFLKYPELRERSFVISSFGKTYHTTGWRMGYCIAPEHLSTEFRKVHQYNTFSVPTPMQYALADFLEKKEEYLGLPDFYQRKRDLFLNLMSRSRFKGIPSSGTYFQLMNFGDIANESDVDFAARLTRESGVACIPISVFYHTKKDDSIIRFCFAKEDETLENAARKLCRI